VTTDKPKPETKAKRLRDMYVQMYVVTGTLYPENSYCQPINDHAPESVRYFRGEPIAISVDAGGGNLVEYAR
jgi:hypothetical protein